VGDQLGEAKKLCYLSSHEVQESREKIADGVNHAAKVRKKEEK
jgi:hypothetical protein